MTDKGTRDIALEALTMIKAHQLDCEKFRVIILDSHKTFTEDLKKINWRMAMILGGLVVISHGIDWVVKLVGT